MKQCGEEQSHQSGDGAELASLPPGTNAKSEGWKSEDEVPWRRTERRSWEPYPTLFTKGCSSLPQKGQHGKGK